VRKWWVAQTNLGSRRPHGPGVKVVDTIVTEMAYIRVTSEGLLLEEIAPGLTVDDVQKATEAKLRVSSELKTM
jgi:3-oxoacid CoA-transferase subunit B